MAPQVDILIQPFCLRFSLHQGVPIYYATADPRTQLDGLEELLDIHPPNRVIFDCNLGFLPVASTTLIRGKRNILVDPNNTHIGGYGMLRARLAEFGLTPADVDVVVNTHCHHDHSGSNFVVRGKTLVIGEGELEYAREIYWPEYVEAYFSGIMKEVQIVREADGLTELDDGVWVTATRGHTPGSISVLVASDQGRFALVGDLTMIRDEYRHRTFSRWYTPEQVGQLNDSLDRVLEWRPDWIVPGHDHMFPAE